MSLTLQNLSVSKGAKRKKRRLGRGNASGRGTYSGRGQKGQRSRSGGRRGLKQRALRQLFQRVPKLGGFKSLKPKATVVPLADLQKKFRNGETVNKKILINKGLASGRWPVKILATGTISFALHVRGCQMSAGAREKIIAAGGSVE